MKNFKIKYLGRYHNFYMQSDTLLRAGVFESFCYKCFEMFEIDPVQIFPSQVATKKACLKSKSEIRIVNKYRYAANVRKRNQKWIMSRSSLIYKCKQKYINA